MLQESALLQSFFSNPDLRQITQTKRLLERKYFQNYWSRYDIDFYFYDADTLPISTYIPIKDDPAKKLDQIIQEVGQASDVSPYIFYVSDFSDNLSYVVRQPILDSSETTIGLLYLGLRSKVIPQEIGFPRLLLNDQSRVFFKLENYQMAKYVHGKLTIRYGSFNYPLTIGSFLIDFPKKSGILYDGDYVHLVTHGESNKTIILTKNRVNFEEYLTTFSFLFSTFGVLLIVALLASGKFASQWNTIKLAFRIQLLFIALVFFALLFSGIGTGTYVKQQYLEYQEDQLREKVSSVEKELQNKLEYEANLNEAILTNYLEFLLNKFSAIFITDINLYGTKGNLLASSRPEIFNLGLLGTQMNARAFRQMYNRNLSLYVNQESIGNQEYLSAYVPLNNSKNEVIAYINLPYFAKQSDFDDEIAGFLSAIINIFVLLLALSVVIAVFITSKIVDPLKQIQASLSDFRLGKSQQPIAYKGNDEIGVLVREYNAKLKELQESSEKLAQSEREMAWREMAKQVAHEIKNPLTPMKLRIQHFQRAFDPHADNVDERIQKFADSLIEQIDALTHIANAFSNFAKMPRAQFDIVDIVHVMQSAVETFSAEENILIDAHSAVSSLEIEADKELLLRVFNNLIKNAIQAIPQNVLGQIKVHLNSTANTVEIQIQDNGTGIDESMREKIFAPNFTTKSTGAGLGLAMVKQIIASHQGEIRFESRPGQTIFTIQLPLKQK
jgi:signal transduction histidine kinase